MQLNYGLDVLPLVGEVLQKYCGWSDKGCHLATQDYYDYMENNCIPDYILSQKSLTLAHG